jgi:predicted enzyme related to lactoylglutathione lyase
MKLIVDIQVEDLARAIHFYENIVGLPCRTKQDSWAAMTIGDAEIHLYLHGGSKGHVEFYVDDIDEKVKELSAKGVVFASAKSKPEAISVEGNNIITFPWGRTAFFKDSEGNELAIVKDNTV